MSTKLNVLVAGRSKAATINLAKTIAKRSNLEVRLRHIVNGNADPLADSAEVPSLLVLHMEAGSGAELDALLERPASARPPLIVVSEAGDPAVMRLAMKAGARDFLNSSAEDEVLNSIDTVSAEIDTETAATGRLIAVVNAKGGSGATFIACNLAHLAVSATEESTALIGLDMQFPTLPAYFDLKMRHGLVQALESVEEMDSVALDAMLTPHKSGLKLLAARPDEFRFSFDGYADTINRLFDLLQANYRNVVADVPRRIDELNAQVLSRAAEIVVVVQQSLPHIQDATRLQQLLRDQLGIPMDRVTIAVNRYDKKSEITLDDIEKAFPESRVEPVPNQFKEVSESINLGMPIYESARQSQVARALIKLQSALFGLAPGDHPALRSGGLKRLQSLFGGH